MFNAGRDVCPMRAMEPQRGWRDEDTAEGVDRVPVHDGRPGMDGKRDGRVPTRAHARRTDPGTDPLPHHAWPQRGVRSRRQPLGNNAQGRDRHAADLRQRLRHGAALLAERPVGGLHRLVPGQHRRLRGAGRGRPGPAPDLPLDQPQGRQGQTAHEPGQHRAGLDAGRQGRGVPVAPHQLQPAGDACLQGPAGRWTARAAAPALDRSAVVQRQRHPGGLQQAGPGVPPVPPQALLRRPGPGHLDLRLQDRRQPPDHPLEGCRRMADVARRHDLLHFRPRCQGRAEPVVLFAQPQSLQPADPFRHLRHRLADPGQ